MKTLPLLVVSLLLLNSCKTREDIEREKLVDTLNVQVQESQRINTAANEKLQELQEKLSTLTGQLEETEHRQKQTLDERIKNLEEKITLIDEKFQANEKTLAKLQEDFKAQNDYIKNVLKTLNKMAKKPKKKKKLSPYDQAMSYYKRGKYGKAKPELLTLLDSKKLSSDKKKRIIHNLGMIEYVNKKYDQSLVYFSRLFTEYPKSGYNKNGLLHLGKAFQKLGKKEEAKQTLNELISRFPKAKQVAKAKEILKGL